MFRRSIAVAVVAVVSLTACGSSSSDEAADDTISADTETAAETETDEAAAEPVADDPDDGVVSETEWADVLPRLTDGGVTRPTWEITVAATDFVCADLETTTATTTSEYVAAESEQIVALAPDAGLDSTDVGAIVGTIASYACASSFTVLTNG